MHWRLEVALYALEMLEGVRRVLLCMLEAVEGGLCLPIVLGIPEVMCCMEVVEVGLNFRVSKFSL